MIKIIKISPLNTSSDLYFECEVCGTVGSIHFTNFIINTDNQGNPEPESEIQMDDLRCPKCGKKLNKKSKN